jgi:sugar O-acyltransferase (sialic acid O-acetyltransferase NeuD family)
MPVKLTVTRPGDFVEFRKEAILQGIHQRFEDQVRLHPRNIALKGRDRTLTYAETNGFANTIAAEILSATGKELAQAALLLPNNEETIVALLASLKAHKAYVPLDPNFPKERLRIMLEDADAAVLLTDDQHVKLAAELAPKRVRIINISEIKHHTDAPDPRVPCEPLDLAYILYTSGSTGRPKGIAFLHRNLLHTTMCLTNHLFFAPSDRVTWLHSASFAASVVDIYCCLTNGGTLYPWDVKTQGFIGMADWLVQEKVTTIQWIPSGFRQFLRTVADDHIFKDIRIVVMASEPLTTREVELFRQHFPEGSHLVNQVGTSESYNYRLYPVDHQIPFESVNVPGGYSVSEDRQVLILDEQRRELPPGCVGEIGVKSNYMSAGYWCDDVLTRSKFVQIGADETAVYLTGDVGRIEADGCLIHLGRKDFQVKIRGYRVEVAEVEHVLMSVPGVADSAVWTAKNGAGEDQLVGYLVLKKNQAFNQEQVERHLESRLPDYMVPRRYLCLDSLPSLPTGKVDRKGLPNPFALAATAAASEGSNTPASLEKEMINLFKELLQTDEIHLDSDFSKVGGDSLLAAILMHRIYQRFKVQIAFDEFGESPTTPRHLTNLVAKALKPEPRHFLRKKPESEAKAPFMSSALAAASTEPVYAMSLVERLLSGTTKPVQRTPAAIKDLIIINAGKFGRETFAWATHAIAAGAPWRIKGFLDDRANALVGYDYEPGIIGNVQSYEIGENDVFVGAIGDPREKVKYYSPIIERGGRFVNVIHPLASIGKNVRLGSGIVLAPFSSVTSDVTIGNHVSIGAFSNAGHDTVIGDWCQISSHVGINGNATLGEGVFLGSHACIIPRIRLGDWAFVGAGSVVIREVQPGVKMFGNPAAPIGKVKAP